VTGIGSTWGCSTDGGGAGEVDLAVPQTVPGARFSEHVVQVFGV
jgi:hypothetical protein